MNSWLRDFENSTLHREFDWDLAAPLAVIEKHHSLVNDKNLKIFISSTVSDYKEIVVPLLDKLDWSIIHNDANDYNVIIDYNNDHQIRSPFVSGFIDFGDMIHSLSIGDLAVLIAYSILEKDDPLEIASLIIEGYNEVNKISNEEIEAL